MMNSELITFLLVDYNSFGELGMAFLCCALLNMYFNRYLSAYLNTTHEKVWVYTLINDLTLLFSFQSCVFLSLSRAIVLRR